MICKDIGNLFFVDSVDGLNMVFLGGFLMGFLQFVGDVKGIDVKFMLNGLEIICKFNIFIMGGVIYIF